MRDLAPLARDARRCRSCTISAAGCCVSLEEFGLRGEPTARDAVRDGATLVVMSGDKLLGGPQAGIIVGDAAGDRRAAGGIRSRARCRVDKLTLAALEATLALYRDPSRARAARSRRWRMLTAIAGRAPRRARSSCGDALRATASPCDVVETRGERRRRRVPRRARIPSSAVALAGEARRDRASTSRRDAAGRSAASRDGRLHARPAQRARRARRRSSRAPWCAAHRRDATRAHAAPRSSTATARSSRTRSYLADPDACALLPGAAEAIRTLERARHRRASSSRTRSGIARGLSHRGGYEAVRDARRRSCSQADGARIDAIVSSARTIPTVTGPCECRKPGTLLYRARRRATSGSISSRSLYVGDRHRDVAPGAARSAAAAYPRAARPDRRARSTRLARRAERAPRPSCRFAARAPCRRYPIASRRMTRARSPCSPPEAAPTSRRSSTISTRSATRARRRRARRVAIVPTPARWRAPRDARHPARSALDAHARDGRARRRCSPRIASTLVALAGYLRLVPPDVTVALSRPHAERAPGAAARVRRRRACTATRVHEAVLAAGARAHGADACTSWTRSTTAAPIIAQWPVPVLPATRADDAGRARARASSTCSTRASSTPSRRARHARRRRHASRDDFGDAAPAGSCDARAGRHALAAELDRLLHRRARLSTRDSTLTSRDPPHFRIPH